MSDAQTVMVRLAGIDKAFYKGTVNERPVFSGFDLTVPRGQFVSIIGSNGSGKTTLLNLLCGTVAPDAGAMEVAGKDIGRLKDFERARRIGRVFQDPAKGACPNLTLLENLSLADRKGRRFGLTRGVEKARVEAYRQMLEPLDMGLETMLDQKAGNLSGGQRQALALLIATMTPIDLLILDEHTAALDPRSSETVMRLTDRIVREKKLTALMVTHNLRFAVTYGDRLMMLHEGRAVMDLAGEEKANCAVDHLLDAFNTIRIEVGG